MNLSPHFTLEEFTRSTDHPELVRANVKAALFCLIPLQECALRAEDIRTLFKAPVTIKSGFRCKLLNDAVGSQDLSQHLTGHAFDFTVDGITLQETLDGITASPIPFHQLLIERGCVHLGLYLPGQPNGQVAWWDGGKKTVFRGYSA